MLSFIKHLIKKYFQILWVRHKFSPAVQIGQQQLLATYRAATGPTKISLWESGFRVFSQFEEDGKILFILSHIGIKTYRFIEIGSDDGVNSNCANLALNHQFTGLFIDANPRSINRGKYFYSRYPHPFGSKPVFTHSRVTRENINETIRKAGFTGEIDVLSIDIDGNDYWIWDALEVVSPRIVIIETYINYAGKNIVAPYKPDYAHPGVHPQYHGASPMAMVLLGRKKGYRLIGSNNLGFNFIFLRNDEGADIFPEVSVETILSHPSVTLDQLDPYVLTLPFDVPIP